VISKQGMAVTVTWKMAARPLVASSEWRPVLVTKVQPVLRWAIAALAAAVIFLTVQLLRRDSSSDPGLEAVTLDNCSDHAISFLKPDKVDLTLLYSALDYCYAKSFHQATLSEGEIRRGIYFRQSYQNQVMLWMVVAITISGVLLSGLQLIGSYKLAMLGRAEMAAAGELTLERDKLAVKSSVTGLLILSASLAFFFVYVFFVYTIRENTSSQSRTAGNEAGNAVRDTSDLPLHARDRRTEADSPGVPPAREEVAPPLPPNEPPPFGAGTNQPLPNK